MADRRRITILHVLDDLGPGGAERQLAAFVVRSDKARFRHEVCALSAGGWFVTDLEGAGVRVHILGLAPRRDLVRKIVRLWRLAREVNPDILHATLYHPGVASRVVGWLTGRPVVTSLVSMAYEPEWYLDNPHLVPWKVWVTRTLDVMTARWWGTRFVAISEAVKASALRQFGLAPESICVIPRGVSVDDPLGSDGSERASLRAAFGWQDAYPVIVNVGRLVPQKGQRYAVFAMRDVVQRFPSARLVIIGEGWLRPVLERLVREQGLEDHVVLPGERRDVPALLQAADIFVFPSVTEGLGSALLEAMAAGKPCVVSRIPALREVTGDGAVALLADPQSPASLAVNLLRVAADRGLAERLCEAARARVREHYTIESVVAARESMYEELLADRAMRAKESRVGARLIGIVLFLGNQAWRWDVIVDLLRP